MIQKDDYQPYIRPEVIPEEEKRFLSGPRSRRFEFTFILRVMWEFIKGFRALHFVGPCVTVFGSARFQEKDAYYQKGVEVGHALAKMGFTVMTGGGPGIMEAANRGAMQAGGRSVGCNIVLPFEQESNRFMHKWVTIKYFFVRKVLLLKYSYAFVVMPGGFGTMDELFETITLIQTDTIKDFPVVVFGKEYFHPMMEMLQKMVEVGTVSRSDLDYFLFTDSIEEMTQYLEKNSVKKFGLKRTNTGDPSWILGESNGK